jgi:hypothetical protein
MTQEDLIRHGAAIERLINDQAVQDVFEAMNEIYYKNWQTAATPEQRELIWQKSVVLGELRQKLEQSVAVGQSELRALEIEREREALQARNQH